MTTATMTATTNEFKKIASRNIHNCINNIVGSYYNYLQDYDEEEAKRYLPKSRKALEDEIYENAMLNEYKPGVERFGKAPKEMRFAGTEFIRKRIADELAKDGDVMEIAEVMGW